jgi:hypothetical protein
MQRRDRLGGADQTQSPLRNRFQITSPGRNSKPDMTKHDELAHDLQVIERWMQPDAIDLRELTSKEIDGLLHSANSCLTAVISLRVALESARRRLRRKAN